MAWLAVDSNGQEIICDHELRRFINKNYELRRTDYCCRYEDILNKNPHWTPKIKSEDCPDLGKLIPIIKLPKGSIKKLIGKEITWEDEPVEIK